jgi:hypothetical protein
MIQLAPNSAAQTIYLTLFENRRDLPAFTHYLIELENVMSREMQYFIANVVVENDRYTEITIATNSATPLSGNVLITETGQYWYRVYGQNSPTNLDPTLTVGRVELGVLQVMTQEVYFETDNPSIPDNIVYYE